MTVRRASFLAGLVLAAVAALVVRLRRSRRSERVDLYYEDGSAVTLEAGSPAGERLLAIAREAVESVSR